MIKVFIVWGNAAHERRRPRTLTRKRHRPLPAVRLDALVRPSFIDSSLGLQLIGLEVLAVPVELK